MNNWILMISTSNDNTTNDAISWLDYLNKASYPFTRTARPRERGPTG